MSLQVRIRDCVLIPRIVYSIFECIIVCAIILCESECLQALTILRMSIDRHSWKGKWRIGIHLDRGWSRSIIVDHDIRISIGHQEIYYLRIGIMKIWKLFRDTSSRTRDICTIAIVTLIQLYSDCSLLIGIYITISCDSYIISGWIHGNYRPCEIPHSCCTKIIYLGHTSVVPRIFG